MTIIFLPVKDTSSKLAKLSNVAQKHLEKKEPLLFLVPDQPALEFLDKLLWTTPSESFLPHPTPLLQISLELQSPFSAIFNLKPAPLLEGSLLKGSAKTIYEFEDHTSAERYELAKHRYQTYRDKNYPIVVEYTDRDSKIGI